MAVSGFNFIEFEKRIFCLSKYSIEKNEVFSEIRGKDLTILMTPFASFESHEVDISRESYHHRIVDYLRNGDTPGIILDSENLDRLMIETIKGNSKHPRIFIQSGTDIHRGFIYYKDSQNIRINNKLVNLVDKINPKSINVGGWSLSWSENDLIEWNLEEHPLEFSADDGCYVNPIYLMFRDKYFTSIAKDLVARS